MRALNPGIVPTLSVILGVLMLAAAIVSGRPMLGMGMLVVMLVYAGALVVGARSDVVQMLKGEPADERYREINDRAIVFSASAVGVVVAGMFLFEMWRGGNWEPYSLMGFVLFVSYLAALIVQRWRQ